MIISYGTENANTNLLPTIDYYQPLTVSQTSPNGMSFYNAVDTNDWSYYGISYKSYATTPGNNEIVLNETTTNYTLQENNSTNLGNLLGTATEFTTLPLFNYQTVLGSLTTPKSSGFYLLQYNAINNDKDEAISYNLFLVDRDTLLTLKDHYNEIFWQLTVKYTDGSSGNYAGHPQAINYYQTVNRQRINGTLQTSNEYILKNVGSFTGARFNSYYETTNGYNLDNLIGGNYDTFVTGTFDQQLIVQGGQNYVIPIFQYVHYSDSVKTETGGDGAGFRLPDFYVKVYTDAYSGATENYNTGYTRGYKDGNSDGYATGYQNGEQNGYTNGYYKGLQDGEAGNGFTGPFSLLGQAFQSTTAVMQTEIFPHFTIGMVIFIPLSITIVTAIIRLIKR